MQNTFKNVSCLCLVAVAILVSQLALAAGGEGIPLYRGKDRQARLEEGAKREGEVVWYTSFQTDDANQFIQLFEKRYPFLKVKLVRLTSERVLQRYLMEFQGKTFSDGAPAAKGDFAALLHSVGGEVRQTTAPASGLLGGEPADDDREWLQHEDGKTKRRSKEV